MIVKEEGKYVKKDVWILDTTGSNLMETLAIDFIDNKRTYSNDIKEVFDVLGIEAARQVLYNEFVDVMMGQVGYYGTNAFNLVLDMKETEKLADAQLDVTDANTEIEKMFKISEDKSDVCSKSNIVIQNNIANIKQGETKICDDDYNMGF